MLKKNACAASQTFARLRQIRRGRCFFCCKSGRMIYFCANFFYNKKSFCGRVLPGGPGAQEYFLQNEVLRT